MGNYTFITKIYKQHRDVCICNMDMQVKRKRKLKGLIYILDLAKKISVEILDNRYECLLEINVHLSLYP